MKGNRHFIDIKPKLEFNIAKNSEELNHWDLNSLFSVHLEDCNGSLYIGDESIRQLGGMVSINIPKGDLTATLFPKEQKVLIHLKGVTNSLIIDGHKHNKSWLSERYENNAVIVNIVTALIIIFISAIIATKGKILRDWFLNSSSKGTRK